MDRLEELKKDLNKVAGATVSERATTAANICQRFRRNNPDLSPDVINRIFNDYVVSVGVGLYTAPSEPPLSVRKLLDLKKSISDLTGDYQDRSIAATRLCKVARDDDPALANEINAMFNEYVTNGCNIGQSMMLRDSFVEDGFTYLEAKRIMQITRDTAAKLNCKPDEIYNRVVFLLAERDGLESELRAVFEEHAGANV